MAHVGDGVRAIAEAAYEDEDVGWWLGGWRAGLGVVVREMFVCLEGVRGGRGGGGKGEVRMNLDGVGRGKSDAG
jgi:hypothetical protein